MGIDFSKDFTEAELTAWWDLGGGGQMTDELLEESKRIVAKQEKLAAERETEALLEVEVEKPKAKKRPKKGKKSLHRVSVDNARRRGK